MARSERNIPVHKVTRKPERFEIQPGKFKWAWKDDDGTINVRGGKKRPVTREPEVREYKQGGKKRLFWTWQDEDGRVRKKVFDEKVTKLGPTPVIVKRKIKGKDRKVKVWVDQDGKRHQKVIRKKNYKPPEAQFEERYQAAIQANKKNLMARKIPEEVIGMMREAASLEQEEYAGGIDFEPGTRKAERVLFTRGRHEATDSYFGAYAPGDERASFELKFHTHPAGKLKQGKGWNRGPSPQDISLVSLKQPEIVVQIEPVGKTSVPHPRTKFYLVRSTHDDRIDKEKIEGIVKDASDLAWPRARAQLEKEDKQKQLASSQKDARYYALFYQHRNLILRRKLNKIGLDVRQFNPREEKIWITKEHQKDETREIEVFRMRDRRRDDKNKRKLFGKEKKEKK